MEGVRICPSFISKQDLDKKIIMQDKYKVRKEQIYRTPRISSEMLMNLLNLFTLQKGKRMRRILSKCCIMFLPKFWRKKIPCLQSYQGETSS